ncbi:MAG: CpaF family protein [Candidatus Omnitrophica bacterium]|nr:CpaF family protein [Candidatus Omnitrophota bacterium]MDD5690191.1 CpaF family protein [Candidatus Omnitrophota bacterium]
MIPEKTADISEQKGLLEQVLEKLTDPQEGIKVDFLKIKDQAFIASVIHVIKEEARSSKAQLSRLQEEELLNEVIAYFLELGPIGMLLKDQSISEIMINGPSQVYIERNGKIELTEIRFTNEAHLAYFIERILDYSGRRVNSLEPCVDARLKDGSRVNIVKSPISSVGSLLTIRKMSYRLLTLEDQVRLKTLNILAADFLRACVDARLNILICGGAGSGKTTMLNALAGNISEKERIVTIEDTRELCFNHKHFVPLETRLPNIEGKGEISIRTLLKNALHMRPDRIIIGEVRAEELWDMIQAMNTGHDGSMTTLHANSTYDAMDRLEMLALLGNPNVSSEVARRQIISAVDLIIHMVRLSDGCRRLVQISEVRKGQDYGLDDIFIVGQGDSGPTELKATGQSLRCYNKIKAKTSYTNKQLER